MGLWSFIKDAGKSVGIGRAEASEAPADAIYAEIKELGLDADGVKVEMDEDTVKNHWRCSKPRNA